MKRIALIAALLLALPAAVQAQPRILVGGGFSAPTGGFGDVADPGYHLEAGLQIALPGLPMSLRGDGSYHRMSAHQSGLGNTDVLGGSASLVFHLPGVGLQPYFLGGVGSYRTESGPAGSTTTVTDTGYHGGFGVGIGGGGGGVSAFAEIRYVKIDAGVSGSLIPLTLGLRF